MVQLSLQTPATKCRDAKVLWHAFSPFQRNDQVSFLNAQREPCRMLCGPPLACDAAALQSLPKQPVEPLLPHRRRLDEIAGAQCGRSIHPFEPGGWRGPLQTQRRSTTPRDHYIVGLVR